MRRVKDMIAPYKDFKRKIVIYNRLYKKFTRSFSRSSVSPSDLSKI